MKNKLNFTLFVLSFVMTQSASAQDSDWWWHTSYKSTDNPPKFCVKDGVFTGPTRCMDWSKAEELGFDTRKVYGAANNPTVTSQLAKAQTEIKKAEAEYETRREELTKLEGQLTRLKNDSENGSFTRAEFAALDIKIKALEASTKDARSKAEAAKTLLDSSKIAALPTQGKVDLQSEIARKGLLIRFTDLEKRLGSFEANIDAVETEFNNTALEAYLTAKLGKVADNFCELKKTCDSDPKSVKKKFMDAVVSQELKSSASGAKKPEATGQK